MSASNPINPLKLSVFSRNYWPDEASRPCLQTLKNHIKAGMLSGRQIGTMWYVDCTAWGEPLRYNREASNDSPPEPQQPARTGNARADAILKRIAR